MKSTKQRNAKKVGETGMNAKERNKRQNERLLSVIEQNILLARTHEREGRTHEYFCVMAFVHGMTYACGLMRPQFRWTKKINDFYDALNEPCGT